RREIIHDAGEKRLVIISETDEAAIREDRCLHTECFRKTVREAQFCRTENIGKRTDGILVCRAQVARANAATVKATDRVTTLEEMVRQRNIFANAVDIAA